MFKHVTQDKTRNQNTVFPFFLGQLQDVSHIRAEIIPCTADQSLQAQERKMQTRAS